MEDNVLLAQAQDIIETFRSSVESNLSDSRDKQKLLELTDDLLATISDKVKVTNKILIEMEKFYQSTSMIIGLSLSDSKSGIYESWRAYDKFHFNHVKPNLTVYGNTFLM
ncbi:hypothetical protein MKL29_04210 [Streptococcus suis]|nr:hypothetical protein [Streptococcus suis]